MSRQFPNRQLWTLRINSLPFVQRYLYAAALVLLMPSLVLAGAQQVAIPALAARVTDLTNTLSSEQQSALESRLE